jgi:signal transduction histidine kinase
VQLEYTGLFFVVTGITWYSYSLYPSSVAKTVARLFTIIYIACLLLILFTPVNIFSYTILFFQPVLIFLLGYLLIKSFQGTLRKNREEMIYFSLFLLVFAGGVHDIIVSLGKAGTIGYILPRLIVMVVFVQALILIYKWINAFHDKEKLQLEMEFMNRNLELLVNERTQELKKRTDEIELQNRMIALKNKELSDTIHLKDRIFSVIAHDLRSPVVNILYMLNLLKEKEYKENYDAFANSSIDYAQRVIGLLENMLLWGREQEDKIKFSPGHHNLADLILTNLSIFKETADKKEIDVNFTQVGSPFANCDRDLLDIIIRNLLSNAVKYTPRKGRVSIFLKNKKNNSEGIMLKICDNGCGISEEKQKQLFTSQEIESTPGSENEKGTGLGLKLCYELVKINNGSIHVESRVSEGTCFTITLPS